MNLSMTHQMPLAACVTATAGPVLELGAGHHSTPLLHGLCLPTKRHLLTVDTSHEWTENFVALRTDWHEVRAVSSYDEVEITDVHWSAGGTVPFCSEYLENRDSPRRF
jgi:hypothetical protein